MKGMMLGLLDGIFSVISSAIMSILGPAVEWIFNYILGPILNLVISIISYILGIYFYGIASFLLGLIDFVELLFRALAGLEASNANSSINLSIDGKSGDILIQLIRHPDIQQAFLSMCIVGLFLLVVTTVFQIIKVEYTTEGAKNSKTPIFQKAFKGLANLMLLPILCIFGIIFSNQLLGLLDKATQGEGDNPTIAGTLFVTAASEAHYRKSILGDNDWASLEIHLQTTLPSLYPIQILTHVIDIAYNSFASSLEGTGWGDGDIVVDYKNDEKTRNEIDTNFINQADGYCYYLIEDVTNYYDYSQINYLLLIFGGCVVLKCLYYTCFGMVVRLYKCAVLFIISPAVIGMTPVNEGGLGKWRGQFIGQVLSAYGTILSINLFFIIVRVLLNVDITFINKKAWGSTAFSSSLMTGLLKSIFVIAGCLLIEKFSKELGGFFGAEDAMGAGKDMSKQVADVAMKGVQVAAAVGGAAITGGASLATGFMQGKGDKKGIAGFVSGLGGAATSVGPGKIAKNLVNAGADIVNSKRNASEGGQKEARNRKATYDLNKDNLAFKTGQQEYKDLEKAELDAKKKVEAIKDNNALFGIKSSDELTAAEKALAEAKKNKSDYEDNNGITNARNNIERLEARNAKMAGAQGRRDERRQNLVDSLARTGLYAAGFMAQSVEDSKGFIPGYKQFYQPADKAAHSGVKLLGDNAEQAMAKIDKDRQKKVEDKWMENPTLAKGAADALIGSAAKKYMKEVAEELKASQQNVTVEASDAIRQLKDILTNIQNNKNLYKNGEYTAEGESQRFDAINQTVNALNAKGANVTFSDVAGFATRADINGKIDINLSDLKMDFDPKKIEKAIELAMRKSGGAMNADVLRDELQKVFNELGEKGNKNMLMQIEAIIKKVMNDLK